MSRKLPRAVLFEFACACAREILLRGAVSHASSLELRQIQGKHPWLGKKETEAPLQGAIPIGHNDDAWLRQVYLSARLIFWGQHEEDEEHLYHDEDAEAEDLASELSDLELKVAARQAVQSRQGVGKHIEEWYAARNAARVRQLHILATLIDAYMQARKRLCELLVLRAKHIQIGLLGGKDALEARLFSESKAKAKDGHDTLDSTPPMLLPEPTPPFQATKGEP
ncbi:hypothetical protein L6R29_19265 [Myxococcota bacterium]|nr:hypothetical protein [Myxococcota bacterium]